MLRTSLSIGLLVALAAIAVPRPAHSQAPRCADEVKKLQNAPELRIQGGTADQVNRRMGAQTFLTEAAQAAAQMFDMKNLNRLKKLDENAPDSMKAFWAFDKAVFAAGALTVQQKQLIAVAVALTTQCPYCIELHNKAARAAGATDAQLAEAALVAAAMRAGAAVTHSTHLFGA